MAALASHALAAITWTGSISPRDPSAWTSTTSGLIGAFRDGTIAVNEGSELQSQHVSLGYSTGSTGEVMVSGSGSQWNNSSSLYVGRDGSGMLLVEDGGHVSTGTLYASLTDLYGDGTVAATEGAVLDGDLLFNATRGSHNDFSFGSGGALTVTANGEVLGAGYRGAGSLTVTDGVSVNSEYGFLGYRPGSTGVAMVSGSGSQWAVDHLRIGYDGRGTLIIQAGGEISGRVALLGPNSGSTGEATVSVESRWNNSDRLYVGYEGSGTLNIHAGGAVTNTDAYLGYYSGSTGEATLSGIGAEWNNSGGLYLGRQGHVKLDVLDGGKVTNTFGYLGIFSGSVGEATVSGAGSQWSNSGGLYVGQSGNATLSILAGGSVANTFGKLADSTNSTSEVTVSGTGSQWINSGDLSVGERGSGTLNVLAGGTVTSADGYLGDRPGALGEATVSGLGSKWINSGVLYVGREGGAALRVDDGGHVSAGALVASLADLYGDGTITANGAILDADLLFDATHGKQNVFSFGSGGVLTVAAHGGVLGAGLKRAGSLTVADGVAVDSLGGTLGYQVGATGEATITGAGSRWNNSGGLSLGTYGRGSLSIREGGTVSNSRGSLGVYSGSTGEATISGVGSQWILSDSLLVGSNGSGKLSIGSSGTVTNSDGSLGDRERSEGEATISGAGSKWTNSGDLYVGRYGSGKLSIEAGGIVSSSSGYLGYYSPGSNVSRGDATVSGVGSQWNNDGSLLIGRDGTGSLEIRAGGFVTNHDAYLGTSLGSFGVVTVTGTGSRWICDGDLDIGQSGQGTLRISHGALVSVAGELVTDRLRIGNGSSIYLSNGGMLALVSDETGDDSLIDFLRLVDGTDSIWYVDSETGYLDRLTNATYGEDYTLEYQTTGDLAGYTLLTVGEVPPYVPGDFNNDGVVDAADYTVARDHLGDPDETAIGYNGDGGGIDESDLALWRANYGSTLEGIASLNGEAVPEPATAVQLLLAACLGLETGRRRGGQVACRR